MERIPYIMVLLNLVDGADNRLSTMAGPLMNNTLEKYLGLIIRGTYQAASEYSRWSYEPVSDSWLDIEPDSDSRDDGSSDEVSKYQDNPDDQEQEKVVLFPRRNP